MAVPETVLKPVLTTEEQAIVQQAEALVINDPTSLAVAECVLTTIARLKKNVEDRRDWLVRPLNDHVKAVNEWVRGMAAPLLQADELLRGKKLAYSNEVERQRREADRIRCEAEAAVAKAAADAVAAGRTPEPVKPVFVPIAPPPVTGIRRTWICEVEDADLVPRQFCSPDAQLLQAAVNAGVREIAGVRIFQRESTVQR
jgi:hypothetical protein